MFKIKASIIPFPTIIFFSAVQLSSNQELYKSICLDECALFRLGELPVKERERLIPIAKNE